MLNQRVRVSSGTFLAPPIVNVVQNDNGRVLICEPFDYVIDGTETASLICRRPSGSVYTNAGTVNALDNEVSFALSDDGGALTQTGDVAAEMILTKDGDTITSFQITLRVQPDISGEATPQEITFVAELQAQVDAAYANYQAALAAVQADLANYVPTTRKVNTKALSSDISLNASDVGAVPDGRKVNGKALSSDISLDADDVGAVPDTRTVNGEQLDSDVVVDAEAVPFTPTGTLVSTDVQHAIKEIYDMIVVGHEVELYSNSGTTSAAGAYALDDDVANYQYLDLYCSFAGLDNIRRIPVDEGTSYSIRFENLADSESSTFVGWSEISLSFSGSVMTVNHNRYVSWSGGASTAASVGTTGKPYIVKVMGVVYDALGSGGGSSNYNDLTNKPSIGGVTLSGDKDIDDLGGIPLPSSPSSGDFLVYDGADWTEMALTTWSGGNY